MVTKEQIKEMVVRVVEKHRNSSKFKGYNPVWKGLNDFIKEKGFNPKDIYEELKNEGKIYIRPMRTKNGQKYILLYLPQDVKKDYMEFQAILNEIK